MRFLPKDEGFFVLFDQLSGRLKTASTILRELFAEPHRLEELTAKIKAEEHAADALTYDIMQRIDRSFVTPLDREDIHSLAISLDDVMDAIDAAAAVMRLYKITHVRAGAKRLIDIVVDATDRITEALRALEKRQGVLELVTRVNQLEREDDRAHQDAIVALFDDERDPIMVIKWKEIFDFLEAAMDRCEDVGNVLEGVVVKHA